MAYTFENGRFVEIWHKQTPDAWGGWARMPQFLVMHYTAGRSGEGAVRTLTKKDSSPRSAHFVVDRDGRIWQICSCDRRAWHAGASKWRGLTGLNNYSIGIEIDNVGSLDIVGGNGTPKKYYPWFAVTKTKDGKQTYRERDAIPADHVIEARHKNGGPVKGWQTYPDAQLRAVKELTRAILHRYPSIKEIIGHDDIAPDRKSDPGPAFPMRDFEDIMRAELIQRLLDRVYYGTDACQVVKNVNCRTSPTTKAYKLPFSPLRVGTKLEVVMSDGDWRYVVVVGKPNHEGWVHGNFIEEDPSRSKKGIKEKLFPVR